MIRKYFITPEVEVTGLSEDDYDVIIDFDEGVDVGVTNVLIKAKGYNYKGEIHRTFTIVPKKAVISKAKAGAGKMTVKAKTKPSKTGGSRYQIQYRVKGTKSWEKAYSKKQSAVIKKLKKGKTYQVRMRAFRKVDRKTYYGAWSRTVSTKKIK